MGVGVVRQGGYYGIPDSERCKGRLLQHQNGAQRVGVYEDVGSKVRDEFTAAQRRGKWEVAVGYLQYHQRYDAFFSFTSRCLRRHTDHVQLPPKLARTRPLLYATLLC